MPHVDVPDKHFGVALGEARTLRTATKEHLEHRIERQKLATCEDDIPTRGAGSVRGPYFCARKTRSNRGNIGIAPPPESACPNFAQSGDWRLALGHMVGNVTGNEGNNDRRSPRRSWCGSTTQLQCDRRTRVVGGRRSHGDGRHHVDLWRTLFWHVLATYTRRRKSCQICAHGPDRTFLKRPYR